MGDLFMNENNENESELSELDQINSLRAKDTNFVFLFGKAAVGKTAIIASIFHFLNTECQLGYLEQISSLNNNVNENGRNLGEIIKQNISIGRFPDRTGIGNLFGIDTCFISSRIRPNLNPLRLTFLDMPGEDLHQVSIGQQGKFPKNIDVFFKAGKLSMTFILVTSYDEAQKDDLLMVNFLDYIYKKSPRFRESRVLLLISKWDKYSKRMNDSDFIQNQMPQTFRKLSRETNSYGTFSLGMVIEEVDELPFIQEYNGRSAERVFSWIYQTLTEKKFK